MPSRRPCLGPGPFHLSEPGKSRCADHQWSGNWPTTTPAERGYGYEWRKTRERVFKLMGRRCMQCGSTTHLEVDHILPKSRGGTDRLDNLQVLCHDCHKAKTDRQGGIGGGLK